MRFCILCNRFCVYSFSTFIVYAWLQAKLALFAAVIGMRRAPNHLTVCVARSFRFVVRRGWSLAKHWLFMIWLLFLPVFLIFTAWFITQRRVLVITRDHRHDSPIWLDAKDFGPQVLSWKSWQHIDMIVDIWTEITLWSRLNVDFSWGVDAWLFGIRPQDVLYVLIFLWF